MPLPYRSQFKAVEPGSEEVAAAPLGACRDMLLKSRIVRAQAC